jgi:hypothetical protein
MTLGYIFTALYGALRLAKLDKAGAAFFDTSINGFWRSFFAAFIVAPFHIVLMVFYFSSEEVSASVERFTSVEAIAYVISWVAFPLLMASIVRLMEKERHYLGFIVAYNWAAVIQNALYLPVAILGFSEAVPNIVFYAFLGGIVFFLIAYSWFIARTMLNISKGHATAVVILDLALNSFINSSVKTLLQ